MVVAGTMSEDYVPASSSSSVESIAEWRSSDQVENGTPSTSPPYWDSDDDDDSGPKPSDLYGKFTWKIENFSQISKRELRSNAFEVGGYRWYILIYPQGCDACNHLSLFLCVANHDKLLPGWSHYALFTIAVVNKDPKKNKYNDTLHRFWKKEHDWGWKKFLEQSKVTGDGFVDDDTLTIKAQVQVIREKAHRPFRCLDCQYRRELLRVYMSNVEQTCGKFVDEKRQKLQKMVGDKAEWSSFHAFWLAIDQNTRRHMSRDKTDAILKVVVKHFFIEKEVSSTLVMDSLYSGLRALESRSKIKKSRAKPVNILEKDDLSVPFIFIENDMFVLADDVFLLLERAALELPRLPLPSKEEKGLPNRTKDGCSGDEFNRDSILRDERRLTELGRRTLEIFILAHIFSTRIEIAYQEAVALKRQEELIREEEAAERAENEKREKRAKKKQAKQRKNNRKGKDGGNNEKSVGTMKEKNQLLHIPSEIRILEDLSFQNGEQINEKSDVSDVSDPGDDCDESLQPDIEERASSSEMIPNGHVDKKNSSFVDDSSSTCSTDSVPSVNGPYKGSTSPDYKNMRISARRGKKQPNKSMQNNPTSSTARILIASSSYSATTPEQEGNSRSSKVQGQRLEPPLIKKEEVDTTLGNKTILKNQIAEEISSISTTLEPSSSSSTSSRKPQPLKQSTNAHAPTTKNKVVSTSKLNSKTPIQILVKSPQNPSISKFEAPKHTTTTQATPISRPYSAPVGPGPKPTDPVASASRSIPLLSRTLSSVNRLDSDLSLFSQNLEPQSYRNAIMGIKTPQPSSSSSTQSTAFTPQTTVNPGFSFGSHSYTNDIVRIGQNSELVTHDEFPHLDIINDLLNEDGIVNRTTFNGYHQNHHDEEYHALNWQHNFPRDFVTADIDPMNGPEYYYDDEISQMVYDSFVPFHGFSDGQPVHLDFPLYGNGMDTVIQNQWPMTPNFGGSAIDANGYAYQIPEYSAYGVGGYNMMYQPANGI